MIKIFTKEIKDTFVRENFIVLDQYVREDLFRKGNFRFMELSFPSAVSQQSIPHSLNFQPFDVIHLSTRKSDTATVTFHYDSFSRSSISVSVSAACTIRFYVGRYGES